MARPKNKGLDYFPQDADIHSDRKIRRLLKEYGATGYIVYDYIKAMCYKENGYWIQADENLCFDIAETLKLDLPECRVQEIIEGCMRLTLFSETVFTHSGIITSAGIQRRYLAAKRKPLIIKEIWVIDATTCESEIPRRAPVAKPALQVAGKEKGSITAKSREKKHKEMQAIITQSVATGTQAATEEERNMAQPVGQQAQSISASGMVMMPPIEGYRDINTLKNILLKDDLFVSLICAKGIKQSLLCGWLDAFNRLLLFRNQAIKMEADYRTHFANWIVKVPGYTTIDPINYSPVREPPAPQNTTNTELERFKKYFV